jgi:hypothetical protein
MPDANVLVGRVEVLLPVRVVHHVEAACQNREHLADIDQRITRWPFRLAPCEALTETSNRPAGQTATSLQRGKYLVKP